VERHLFWNAAMKSENGMTIQSLFETLCNDSAVRLYGCCLCFGYGCSFSEHEFVLRVICHLSYPLHGYDKMMK
jgi:hypothetical protein